MASMSSVLFSFMVRLSCMIDRDMVTDLMVDMRCYGCLFYFLRDVESKGVDEQGAGCRLADAAGAEVEKGVLAELAYRGAVTAFYIVGKDLEFGFRIDGRLL